MTECDSVRLGTSFGDRCAVSGRPPAGGASAVPNSMAGPGGFLRCLPWSRTSSVTYGVVRFVRCTLIYVMDCFSWSAFLRLLTHLDKVEPVAGPVLRGVIGFATDSDVRFHVGLGLALYKLLDVPLLRAALLRLNIAGNGLPAEIAGVASSDVTAVTTARLRRRSRWVCQLAARLVGNPDECRDPVSRLFRGRWIPDLTTDWRAQVVNALTALGEAGVRFHGGGTVPKMGEEGGHEVYLHVELEDGTHHTVFPSLVGELKCHAVFRERDRDTLLALRFRALQWAKKSQLRWFDIQQGFAGSVAVAYVVSSDERAAVKAMTGPAPRTLSFPLL